MTKAYTAVHTVTHGKGEVAQPGTVFVPPADDVAFFVQAGAIREPTEAEMAIYEKMVGVAPAELTEAEKKAAADKEAFEKKATENAVKKDEAAKIAKRADGNAASELI